MQGLGNHASNEGIQLGAEGDFHGRVVFGGGEQLYPDKEGYGRLHRFELDGFVGFPFDNAQGNVPGRAGREFAVVAVAMEIGYFVFGDSVAQAFEVGKVGQHLKYRLDICRDGFYRAFKGGHRFKVCFKENLVLFPGVPGGGVFAPLFQCFEVVVGDVSGFEGGFEHGFVVAEGDDIVTTGATLLACTEALQAAKPAGISLFTLSFAR